MRTASGIVAAPAVIPRSSLPDVPPGNAPGRAGDRIPYDGTGDAAIVRRWFPPTAQRPAYRHTYVTY